MTDRADRNRSEIVTVATPRERVDVMHQEMRGLNKDRGWETFWLARRTGKRDWERATTPREAIRRATLLPPSKPPAWLGRATEEAQAQLRADSANA